jgi:hypothetical protein
MNQNKFNHENQIGEIDFYEVEPFTFLMRKVYVWMTLALVITGITAYGVADSPSVLSVIADNQVVFWGLIIAELTAVIVISGAINKLSLATATLLFVFYSVINGATMAIIFAVYEISSIAHVFFITAGTFAVMAVIGYTTKTDLTSMGKFLMMALIGLIIASLVNIFLVRSTGMDLIISYTGVLIFVGLTIYDSWKIKMQLMDMDSENIEISQKIALLGALQLYLDFVNLFLYLLRIMGKRK